MPLGSLRDQLSDPNALRPGQVLKIPVLARQE
jgi:nucleoid-associated protein YgaU